jgi:hypothetical protein
MAFRTLADVHAAVERELMRWVAVALATSVAAMQVALFVVAEQQLQAALSVLGPDAGQVAWLRWLWLAGWAAPWVVGAALLARGSVRHGGVVVLASASLALVTGLAEVRVTATGTGLEEATDLFSRFGGPGIWVLALAAAAATVAVLPRRQWRVAAPGPVGWYVALAIMAWLPAAFRSTAFAPPGAPRRFIESHVDLVSGPEAVEAYLVAVVVAALLWVAPRLRPDVAGAVLLTFAGPTLLAEFGSVVAVATQEAVIFTPSGVLGLVGLTGLVIAGTAWVLGGAAAVRRADPHPG